MGKVCVADWDTRVGTVCRADGRGGGQECPPSFGMGRGVDGNNPGISGAELGIG